MYFDKVSKKKPVISVLNMKLSDTPDTPKTEKNTNTYAVYTYLYRLHNI